MSRIENLVVNKLERKATRQWAREQREKREAYDNYEPQLTDEEFAREWEKACQRVKEGLVQCQLLNS